MKLAVVGSRDFSLYRLMEFVLDEYCVISNGDLTIISGGARGADSLARLYAVRTDISMKVFPADWEKHGKSAGYIRNADIVSNCDELVAFWDGKSKGTLHSINLARKQGKKVTVIEYEKIKMETIG